MATIQNLERLYQIQRLFYVGDSLEAAVAGERVSKIIARTEQHLRQRAFLRDERRRLRISSDLIEERTRALKLMQRDDWIPPSLRSEAQGKHVQINVSGLMFQAPIEVLMRDPMSLLAQLCSDDPPMKPDPYGGFFYFDRDWWLFRYIMIFMRDGTLPDDRNLLSQLYRESSFWNLVEMQKAIEEEKLHLRSELAGEQAKTDSWWRKLPSWWQSVDEAAKKKAEEEAANKKKEDWWTDNSYKGKTYLPLSTAMDKVITKIGEADELATTNATWEFRKESSEYQGFRSSRSDNYTSYIPGSFSNNPSTSYNKPTYVQQREFKNPSSNINSKLSEADVLSGKKDNFYSDLESLSAAFKNL